jgi:hypothetical protein
MTKRSLAGRSWLSLLDLDRLAARTRLVVRKSRKFTPSGFLQSLLGSVVRGQPSLNQLTASLKELLPLVISRHCLHASIDIRSTDFLMVVLCDLMEQRFRPAVAALGGTIRRILVADSSGQFPNTNCDHFPTHGNHRGANFGLKIDSAFDFLSGSIVSHSLQAAPEQDKTIGKDFLSELRRGAVVSGDLGYFSLGAFAIVEAREARWLTRLPLTTGVTLANGDLLEKRLKGSQGEIIDLMVFAWEQGKTCRLVAVREAPEVVAARHAERREETKRSGKTPCGKGIVRDVWHNMLTNLGKDKASVGQLAAGYRARWAVEIQFQAWKQAQPRQGAQAQERRP